MALIQYNILFKNGKPILPQEISRLIGRFDNSYNRTVRFLIQNTTELNEQKFCHNAAKLLNNFGMARSGPFRGIGVNKKGEITGPREKITACWNQTKADLKAVEKILEKSKCLPRTRTLIQLDPDSREQVVLVLWQAFKKMLPITMGENSYGLVGTSKILFSVFPEIALPIDNAEWLHVFETVDFGDVLCLMADEIFTWEKATGFQLQNCDTGKPQFTLPAVYNVMAMEARPKNK